MGDARAEPGGAAAGEDDRLAGPAGGRRDPGLAGQRVQRDRVVVGQRMRLGQRDVEGVGQQRVAEEARVVGGRDARGLHRQGDVELVAAQRLEAQRRLGLLDQHPHARRTLGQQLCRGQREAGQRRREPTHPQLARLAGGVRVEIGPQQLHLGEQGVAVGEQDPGRGRQAHAAPVGLQQRLADLALQRRQLLRHGGRRQMQRIRGRGDRAAVGELAQRAQAAEVNHVGQLTGRRQKVHSF